jgi:hypothetical protein
MIKNEPMDYNNNNRNKHRLRKTVKFKKNVYEKPVQDKKPILLNKVSAQSVLTPRIVDDKLKKNMLDNLKKFATTNRGSKPTYLIVQKKILQNLTILNSLLDASIDLKTHVYNEAINKPEMRFASVFGPFASHILSIFNNLFISRDDTNNEHLLTYYTGKKQIERLTKFMLLAYMHIDLSYKSICSELNSVSEQLEDYRKIISDTEKLSSDGLLGIERTKIISMSRNDETYYPKIINNDELLTKLFNVLQKRITSQNYYINILNVGAFSAFFEKKIQIPHRNQTDGLKDLEIPVPLLDVIGRSFFNEVLNEQNLPYMNKNTYDEMITNIINSNRNNKCGKGYGKYKINQSDNVYKNIDEFEEDDEVEKEYRKSKYSKIIKLTDDYDENYVDIDIVDDEIDIDDDIDNYINDYEYDGEKETNGKNISEKSNSYNRYKLIGEKHTGSGYNSKIGTGGSINGYNDDMKLNENEFDLKFQEFDLEFSNIVDHIKSILANSNKEFIDFVDGRSENIDSKAADSVDNLISELLKLMYREYSVLCENVDDLIGNVNIQKMFDSMYERGDEENYDDNIAEILKTAPKLISLLNKITVDRDNAIIESTKTHIITKKIHYYNSILNSLTHFSSQCVSNPNQYNYQTFINASSLKYFQTFSLYMSIKHLHNLTDYFYDKSILVSIGNVMITHPAIIYLNQNKSKFDTFEIDEQNKSKREYFNDQLKHFYSTISSLLYNSNENFEVKEPEYCLEVNVNSQKSEFKKRKCSTNECATFSLLRVSNPLVWMVISSLEHIFISTVLSAIVIEKDLITTDMIIDFFNDHATDIVYETYLNRYLMFFLVCLCNIDTINWDANLKMNLVNVKIFNLLKKFYIDKSPPYTSTPMTINALNNLISFSIHAKSDFGTTNFTFNTAEFQSYMDTHDGELPNIDNVLKPSTRLDNTYISVKGGPIEKDSPLVRLCIMKQINLLGSNINVFNYNNISNNFLNANYPFDNLTFEISSV